MFIIMIEFCYRVYVGAGALRGRAGGGSARPALLPTHKSLRGAGLTCPLHPAGWITRTTAPISRFKPS